MSSESELLKGKFMLRAPNGKFLHFQHKGMPGNLRVSKGYDTMSIFQYNSNGTIQHCESGWYLSYIKEKKHGGPKLIFWEKIHSHFLPIQKFKRVGKLLICEKDNIIVGLKKESLYPKKKDKVAWTICAPPPKPKPRFDQAQVDKEVAQLADKLTAKQMAFFRKYGFVVLKGHVPKTVIKAAKKTADELVSHAAEIDGGSKLKVFGSLPEAKRLNWANMEDVTMRAVFRQPHNTKLLTGLIGKYTDINQQYWEHGGLFTFAPRFYRNSQDPITPGEEKLVEPYNVKQLPSGMDPLDKTFLKEGAEMGFSFAPTQFPNWHIDGQDVKNVLGFTLLWGTYLNNLQKGNKGNLLVYPGSHYSISDIYGKKGAYFYYNAAKGEKLKKQPDLKFKGKCSGTCFQVCVEAGDVVIAHPFTAHGIGLNLSKDPRYAVYCRLRSDSHDVHRAKVANKKVLKLDQNPKLWPGNMFHLYPGLTAQ